MFKIAYYRTETNEPIKDFIDSKPEKVQLKMLTYMKLLSERGTKLREPYSKKIANGLFELRIEYSSNQYRMFYFFWHKGTIAIVHAVDKKTQKLKQKDIDLAIKRKKELQHRKEAP